MHIICYSCGRGEQPENTLEGIQHCLSINPSWRIEMDIQITKDGTLVLFHDENTLRVTGENECIAQLNLEAAKSLNVGYHFQINNTFPYRKSPIQIPTLKSVFQQFPKIKVLLDIHTDDLQVVDHLIDLIERDFKNGDFIIVSQYDEIISQFKERQPQWTYGVPAKEAKKMLYSSFLCLDRFFPITSNILMLPQKYGKINVLNQRVIRHAKKRNKEIWAWKYEGEYVKTVNSKIELEELKTMGIQGIFTEFPKKLLADLG